MKDQRIIVLMTPSEVEAIDEWGFANRIRSRGDAIRRLCIAGMSSHSLDADRGELIAALKMAKGYLTNASIDLKTGAPKRTAIATVEGGIAAIDAVLAKAGGDQ